MKIKIYILTWNDAESLDKNLSTLFNGFSLCPNGVDIHVNVINNHTNFYVNPIYGPHINVIHNRAQPDFATAMLARMWNTALIHGFVNLQNPDCDIVVTVQDDAIWEQNWISNLLLVMDNFDFYSDDSGDTVCAYKTNALMKIGMWDERFHYGFGEGDYYLRAVKYLPEKSSINDFAHGRVWNPSVHLTVRPNSDVNRITEQYRAHKYRGLSWANFLYKWKNMDLEARWPDNVRERVLTIEPVPSTILYPYFEMDIENLQQKGYIVP